jgi:hypothetical protein
MSVAVIAPFARVCVLIPGEAAHHYEIIPPTVTE